mmetsp:Transcript_56481/g.135576  ORF Transcript_56481/g.135576 Transcript_56481/m.135576 type:complete len:252 (-) Transcript_56481:647-1402(-)
MISQARDRAEGIARCEQRRPRHRGTRRALVRCSRRRCMANRGKGTKRHSKRKRGGRLCLRRRRHCYCARRRRHCCRGHRRRRGRRLRGRHCSRSNSGCRFRRLSSSSSCRPRALRSCTEGLWSRIGASQRRGRMPALSRSSHRLPAARWVSIGRPSVGRPSMRTRTARRSARRSRPMSGTARWRAIGPSTWARRRAPTTGKRIAGSTRLRRWAAPSTSRSTSARTQAPSATRCAGASPTRPSRCSTQTPTW